MSDSIVDLDAVSGFPCEIVAVPTGVVLRPSEAGAHPDPEVGPLTRITEDSRGRYFTTARRERRILVWDADGSFVTALGAEGKGPGEIAGRVVDLFIDGADSLHVLDASGRWLVFDPALRFARMIETGVRSGLRYTNLADDGTIVHTRPVPGGDGAALVHVMDHEGRLVRSFGTPRTGRERDAREERPSVAGIEGDLWIAPATGMEGFVMERWSLDGRRRQLIRRPVPWLPLDGYPDEPRAPDFKFLNVDQDGLLWVGVVVKDAQWSPSRPGEHPDQREAEQADFRLEVIDPRGGRVLASVRYDYFDERTLPPMYPVGRWSRTVWGSSVDSLGLSSIRIYDLHLVAKH